jgi:biopolymer transport protein ExbD
MRKKKPLAFESGDSEVNMTPMLDVVFILLVFFVVTSSFVRESGVEARSSDSSSSEGPSEAILLRIDDSNGIWIDDLQIDFRAVRANIERLRAINPEYPVIVQTARNSTTQTLVRVIDAARSARVEDIAVAADAEFSL